MPIPTVEEPSLDANYVIFWASRDENGKMWCPDCRDTENLTYSVFGNDETFRAEIVYVGSRPEWKKPADNKWRREPWNIAGVPTIVKLVDGKEEARLVEEEILDKSKLEAFLGKSLSVISAE